MTRIRVGLVTAAFFYVPFWAAKQTGLYAAKGLQVDIEIVGGIEAVTRRLKDGSIDIGIGSPEHVIHDVERGGELRMLGGNVNRLTHSLIVQPDIHSLEDLRGRRIGVSALTAGTSSLFMGILAQRGLHYPGDYSVVEVGAVPPRHAMLLKGEIDAGMQTDPHNYMAEDAGLNNLGPLSRWIPDFQFTTINARASWISAHREAVAAFLEASIAGSRLMADDRDAAVDIAARFMQVPRGYLERAWVDHVDGAVALDLHLNRAGIDTALALMRRDRTLTHAIDPLATADTYVEARPLRVAQANLGLPPHILD